MRLQFACTVLAMVAVVALSAGVGTSEGPLGGWSPIRNVNDPVVQEIARFAVAEHNSQSGTSLVYLRVLSGESQVVSGTNYRLRIVARPRKLYRFTRTYEAVVYDQPWTNTRELTSFKLIA